MQTTPGKHGPTPPRERGSLRYLALALALATALPAAAQPAADPDAEAPAGCGVGTVLHADLEPPGPGECQRFSGNWTGTSAGETRFFPGGRFRIHGVNRVGGPPGMPQMQCVWRSPESDDLEGWVFALDEMTGIALREAGAPHGRYRQLYRLARTGPELEISAIDLAALCRAAVDGGLVAGPTDRLELPAGELARLVAAERDSGAARLYRHEGRPPGPDRTYAAAVPESDRYSLLVAPGVVVELTVAFGELGVGGAVVEVYERGAPTPAQVLEAETTERPPGAASGLSASDYDGDGFRDLEVVDWWGATGNIGYRVFLYDPESGRFSPSEMYDGGGEPDGTGCVRWHGVAGHAGALYSSGYSCPRDGRLQVRWSERQDGGNPGYVRVRKTWSETGELERVVTEDTRGDTASRRETWTFERAGCVRRKIELLDDKEEATSTVEDVTCLEEGG